MHTCKLGGYHRECLLNGLSEQSKGRILLTKHEKMVKDFIFNCVFCKKEVTEEFIKENGILTESEELDRIRDRSERKSISNY